MLKFIEKNSDISFDIFGFNFVFVGEISFIHKIKIMAVLSKKSIAYVEKIYFSKKESRFSNFANDPVLLLADCCIDDSTDAVGIFSNNLIMSS